MVDSFPEAAEVMLELDGSVRLVRRRQSLDQALANNQAVNWLPEHIKDGRFGDFLENNVDWALSRERFWGTPLNIWVNDETGAIDAPA